MPAHIYIHTGDHELAARANELGIKADEDYFKAVPEKGLYRMMYYSHNIHFLAFSRMAQGNLAEASQAADKLIREVEPTLEHMPEMEPFLLIRLQVLLRFHRWDDILKVPEPPEKRLLSRAFRHHARTVALAGKGRREQAIKEQSSFEAARKKVP